jgi:transposase-like protein
LAVLAEATGKDANISAIARRHGLLPSQVFKWRWLAELGVIAIAGASELPSFLAVQVAADAADADALQRVLQVLPQRWPRFRRAFAFGSRSVIRICAREWTARLTGAASVIARSAFAEQGRERFLEVAGRDAAQIEDGQQSIQAAGPPRPVRQDRWGEAHAFDALSSIPAKQFDPSHGDRADPRLDPLLRAMTVPHDAVTPSGSERPASRRETPRLPL